MTKEFCTLFLDGSRWKPRIGILLSSGKGEIVEIKNRPLRQLFDEVKLMLARWNLSKEDFDSTLFCSGPGNVACLRATEMFANTILALRKRHRTCAYDCFELIAYGQRIWNNEQTLRCIAPISAKIAIDCTIFGGTITHRNKIAVSGLMTTDEKYYIIPTMERLPINGKIYEENRKTLLATLIEYMRTR
jgi:hypothetical protein